MKLYSVVVIGGGHAGTEACAASARLGVDTLLITHDFYKLGELSCNPAVGGLGKSHLVREIDALDGLMGINSDLSGLHFRVLNQSKGPAVQSPRVQCDRQKYRYFMQATLKEYENLTIVSDEVLAIEKQGVEFLITTHQHQFLCKSVVVTSGTFLNGKMHTGTIITEGGRVGEPASRQLSTSLSHLNIELGRLKTGTPARLKGRTIDFESLTVQESDTTLTPLSFLTRYINNELKNCYITYTNTTTHSLIQQDFANAPIINGQIASRGPRYCPSIEDKIRRFSDKESHQIFLEPEGIDDDTYYPNGISTSLDKATQEAFIRSIKGLEKVEILRFGYAVEYDFADPRQLTKGLQLKSVPGLFFAGQINGTTGYEEAGAQGLVAGLNAARFAAQQSEVHFSREDSYIGVLIDDLTTKGVTEPYRMFTSRAENRLHLRINNADQRLTPLGIELGLINSFRQESFTNKMNELDSLRAELLTLTLTPNQAQQHGIYLNQDGKKRNALELLSLPTIQYNDLARIWPQLSKASLIIRENVQSEALYAGYIQKYKQEQQALNKAKDKLAIPYNINFNSIKGLSNEIRDKLTHKQPKNLQEASQIEGMTPSALGILLVYLKKNYYDTYRENAIQNVSRET